MYVPGSILTGIGILSFPSRDLPPKLNTTGLGTLPGTARIDSNQTFFENIVPKSDVFKGSSDEARQADGCLKPRWRDKLKKPGHILLLTFWKWEVSVFKCKIFRLCVTTRCMQEKLIDPGRR